MDLLGVSCVAFGKEETEYTSGVGDATEIQGCASGRRR